METNPSGSEKERSITYGRLLLIVLVGVVVMWSVVLAISLYIAILTPTMIAIWRANGSVVAEIAILSMVLFRFAEVNLRLGVANEWNRIHDSEWFIPKRPLLLIEVAIYLFVATCFCMITSIQVWPATFVAILAAEEVAICVLALGCYWVGKEVNLDSISEIKIGYWFIPLSGRYPMKVRIVSGNIDIKRSVPEVPTIKITWKRKCGTAVLERSLSAFVWAGPIVCIVAFALIVRTLRFS